MTKHPRVGIGVIITNNNKVLLGKRKNAHGDGTWCFPGGHLEFGESFEDCARREVLEETGLHVGTIGVHAVTNDFFQLEQKHYVTIFMSADYIDGIAQVLEPDKCEKWEWCAWDELPQPLFVPIENLIKQRAPPKPNRHQKILAIMCV